MIICKDAPNNEVQVNLVVFILGGVKEFRVPSPHEISFGYFASDDLGSSNVVLVGSVVL